MTVLSPSTDALNRAEGMAREGLLNAVLRETGATPSGPGPWRIDAPGGGTLVADMRQWSPSGHHRWGRDVTLEVDGRPRPVTHGEFVRELLAVVAASVPDGDPARAVDRIDALAEQIANSVVRTTRFLAAPAAPEPADDHGRTRHAEQSLRRGHPFHPTPKCLRGAGLHEVDGFAPELRASFRLSFLAVDPDLVVGDAVGPGPWLPDEAVAAAPTGRPVLPVHPWQLGHLRRHPDVAPLLADGRIVELGERGGLVYPTSSVRTVCDPTFPTAWKLPLHLRITNFVRNVPAEHAVRSTDASRVVAALRTVWGRDHPGFGAIVETGWRGVDPAVVGAAAAADLNVVFRENPFVTDPAAPRVLAALIEEGPHGEEPPLVREVRASGVEVGTWLREYLEISLRPLLAIFGEHGIGFEAHLQNTLLHTEAGRPARFWVRDMEGTHVNAACRPPGLDTSSPLVYGEDEAWRRLRYHAVVNQLATVVAVLGSALARGGEGALWGVVADVLAEVSAAGGPAARWADDLTTAPTLPAKANLLSRFAERGEDPWYVDVPNPIRGARP